MEKAITAEIQQLQGSVISLLLATCSVHMKLPASTFRGLLSQKTVREPNCKKMLKPASGVVAPTYNKQKGN